MIKSAQNMLYQVHIDNLGDVYSLCGVNASFCCSENRICAQDLVGEGIGGWHNVRVMVRVIVRVTLDSSASVMARGIVLGFNVAG